MTPAELIARLPAAELQMSTERLAELAGEPGYEEALRAEALTLAMLAAGRTVELADEADARLIGLLTQVLIGLLP